MGFLKPLSARQSTLLHPLGTSSCPVGPRSIFPTLLGRDHASCLAVSSAQLPASSSLSILVHLFLAAGSPRVPLSPRVPFSPCCSFPVEAAGLVCAGAAVAGASPVSATGPDATAPPQGLQAPPAPHLPETVDSPWWRPPSPPLVPSSSWRLCICISRGVAAARAPSP